MAWDWIKQNTPTLIALGGLFWYVATDNATMKAKMDEGERYRTARSVQTDTNFEKVNNRIEAFADLPLRVKALETQTLALTDRLDRIANAIATGQESLRRDFATSTEAIRKDVANVVVKVEVLSDRLGVRQERTGIRPVPTGG